MIGATFTGAGFTNEVVTTPLGLVVWGTDLFAIQLLGQNNVGISGWQTGSVGPFITDVNDLTTLLPTPYWTTGSSTFWFDALGANAWTLASGDTIGADLGGGGPDGIFYIGDSLIFADGFESGNTSAWSTSVP